MPPDVELTVEQMTPSVFPIMSVVLTGGDNPAQLRDYAFYQLAPQIKNIPDVLYANVAGGDVREIEVEARPDDLLAAGLSAADLADQIGKVHRLQPVGRIEQPPFAFQIIVNTQGETARQIDELVICHARTTSRCASATWPTSKCCTRTACSRSASRARTPWSSPSSAGWAATRSTSRSDIRDTARPRQPPPRNIQATVAYDQAHFVDTAVDNVRDAILIGGLFSILILLAFLRSWRATLISALAIPTTLAITFLFLHWAGETLNLMSLGGLAVAIGLIIDDTVVVIENIARHLVIDRRSEPVNGSDNRQLAAIDPIDAASGEITGAVVGSTLTTVLVFVPLAFIVGVYGQFFAVAELVAVDRGAGVDGHQPDAGAGVRGEVPGGPADAGAGPIYRFLAELYERACGVALRFPLADAGALAGRGRRRRRALSPASPTGARARAGQAAAGRRWSRACETGLMPAMDEGAFVVDYLAPSGTPLAADRGDGPAASKTSCSTRTPTSKPTSAAPAPSWACSPPRPTAATSRSSCGRRRTIRSAC